MTPVAAYYLFLAEENERAAKANRFRPARQPRQSRPSLFDRLRAVASALRTKPSVARSA